MRIMLVDDEALARIEIRSLIPWGEHGNRLVGEAANGKEALRLSKECKPDIIIADIVMPEMDGLDLIEQVKKELPLCKFIIVSCMDKLDFYKKAISLNVSDYILKDTIQAEELLQVLERVTAEIDKNRVYSDYDDSGKEFINKYAILMEFLNLVFEKKIRDEAAVRRKFDSFGIRFSSERIYVMTFALDYPEVADTGYDGALDDSIVMVCQTIIARMGGGYIYKNKENRIVAIFACPPGLEGESFIRSSFSSMQDTIGQYFDLRVTAGVSGEKQGFTDLHEGYREALSSMDAMIFDRMGQVHFHGESRGEDLELGLAIKARKKEISSIQSVFELDGLKRNLEELRELFRLPKSITSDQVKEIYRFIAFKILELLNNNGSPENKVLGERFNATEAISGARTVGELHSRLLELVGRLQAYYYGKIESKQLQIVNEINAFIEDNLDRKISLKEISQKVHSSREYICRLYKKETGENLTHYIVKRKLEKSKELLIANHSITQITGALGFMSDSYFIKVFKAQTGMTPTQFVNDKGRFREGASASR